MCVSFSVVATIARIYVNKLDHKNVYRSIYFVIKCNTDIVQICTISRGLSFIMNDLDLLDLTKQIVGG